MALILLGLLLCTLLSFSQIIIKSNYPLRKNNLLTVMNEENYRDILYMLKGVEDIKKVQSFREGKDVVVLIERYPLIKEVEVRGNIALWEGQIKSFLGIREGEPLREEEPKELGYRLEEFYRSKGFLDARVEVRLDIDQEGWARLQIDVEEGDLYFLGDAVFHGLKSLPKEELLYSGGLRLGEVFREGKVKDAVFSIESFLKRRGFVESFVFLKEVKKGSSEGRFYRVLFPTSGSERERFRDKVFSFLLGVNNLITHPLASWKAISGKGSLAIPHYTLVEGKRFTFSVSGNKSFPPERIMSLIDLENIFSIDVFSIAHIKESLREFYKSKGFFDVQIDITLSGDSEVVIEIHEGKRYRLIYTSPQPLELPSYYDKELIAKAVEGIKERLLKEGYAFPSVSVKEEIDSERKAVYLNLEIKEGKRFVLADITFRGKDSEIERIVDKYRRELPAVYNSKIVEGINREIEALLRDEGYLDGRYDAEVRVEVSGEEVRYFYTYSVERGERYRYGETLIYGNDKTVKREIHYMLVGRDYYSERDVDESTWNLVLSGVFTSAKIETFVDRKRKLVHRLVELREDDRGYFEGALSYNTEELFKLELELGLKNLFGVGLSSTASYSKSQKYETYLLKFEDRFLFSRKFLGDFSLLKGLEFHNSYDLISRGFSLNLGYRWKPRAVMGIFFSSLRNEVVGHGAGDYDVKKWGVFLLFDRRDNLLSPKRVFHARFRASLSTGSQNYMKFEIDSFVLRPLTIKKGSSLSMRFAMGASSGDVPIFDRFFLGGIRDMRGYGYEAIGFPEGGKLYAFYRGELIFPLFKGLKGIVFTDIGAVGNRLPELTKSLKEDVGLSVALDVPVGLVRVDVAKPFDKLANPTSNLRIYLSIGFVY